MRTSVSLIAFLAVIASAPAENLREMIVSMDKKISSAMMKKDIPALRKAISEGVAPDFKYYEAGVKGKPQTFEVMMKNMEMGMMSWKTVSKVNAQLLDLKETGSKAVAHSRHSMAGVMSPDGKSKHKVSYSGFSTDVYRKVGGKWKMASMTLRTDKMTMDGKPFDPSKTGGM